MNSMQFAIDRFHKRIFTILLYMSGLSGYVNDLIMGWNNRTALYALFDVIMIVLGIMNLSTVRSGLWYVILFTLSCLIINFSFSPVSLYASLNGAREIIIILAMVVFYNKIFKEGNEELAEDYINIVKKYGFIFLIAQLPIAAYQYSLYGASDGVGGTFGWGGSGVLTLSVVCFVYYLHFFSRNVTTTVLLYIALIPLFLNETKISFVLIPLMVLLVRFQPKLKSMIFAVGAAILFFLIFNNFYAAAYLDFDNSAAGIFSADFLNDYLMADIYTYDDIPRFTKIILAWNLLIQDAHTFLFGFEYGLFKGGSMVEVSQFAQTYGWMLFGTRPYIFFLILQGGILLMFSFVWLILYINNFFKRPNKFSIFLFIVLLLMLGYNDAFRNQNFLTIYLFLVFYANSGFYNEKVKIV